MARDLVLEVVEQVRGNALEGAARDLDKLASKTDTAAGSARGYSSNLKALDAQIAATQLKIRALGSEFSATHDKAVGTDLRGERTLLRQLERIRKELEQAGPGLGPAGAALGAAVGSRTGAGVVTGIMDAVGGLPSKLRGILLAGVLIAAVPLVPALGATIAGAVVGGAGVGGIVGGIFAASRDPGLRAAASSFSNVIAGEFFAGGQAFVGPTIEALHILEDAFAGLNLGDSWARVAPYVTRVAEGIAGLAERFMPGFNRALDAAGPALEILAQELPDIGDALSDMLIEVSESKGTLEGWLFLLKAIGSTIRVTGTVLAWLSDRFHDLLVINEKVLRTYIDASEGLTGGLLPFTDNMKTAHQRIVELLEAQERGAATTEHVTHGLHGQADAANQLAEAVKRLHQEYSDYLGVQMSVDQANQRGAEAMLHLRQVLKDSQGDWSATTEKGLAARGALIADVQALIAIRQANIDNKVPAEEATAAFEAELTKLEKLAINAGISKQLLQDLVGDYHVRIVVSTGQDAYSRALARALAGTDFPSGFAAGGYPPMGEWFWTGEQGPELMRLGPRPQVLSHGQSAAMAGGGGDTAKALAQMAEVLDRIDKRLDRPPTVINVNAPEQASPKELAAVVSRELDWAR